MHRFANLGAKFGNFVSKHLYLATQHAQGDPHLVRNAQTVARPAPAATGVSHGVTLPGQELFLAGIHLHERSNRSTALDRLSENCFVNDFDAFRLCVITRGELLDDLRRKYESYRAEHGIEPTQSSGLEHLRRVHAEYLGKPIET